MNSAGIMQTAASRNRFRRMYKDGRTNKEIAAAFDVRIETVQKWARELGFSPRKPGRKPGKPSAGRKKRNEFGTTDSPEDIARCLGCEKPYCPGWCEKTGKQL